ncbi:MAG: hypothetical protein ACKN9T_02830 [Candidatus Methylumidiphilus sp.]
MARKFFKKSEESVVVEEAAETGAEIVEVAEAEAAGEPAPKKPLLKRAAYKTLYAVSFGTVFTSLLLRKLLVPKDSVIESALHDGAVAAHQAFEEKERLVAEVIQETEEFLSPEEQPTAAAA